MVLIALETDPNLGLLATQIAALIGAPVTTISMAIRSLVKDECVVRHFPFRDRRQVVVRLTEKGTQQAKAMLCALSSFDQK
jgi:DNA-binding MarR family transcriptional regulator